jgi:anhydro-N-acetylmuramic acid kinase
MGELYIGLISGTSIDGVDAVVAELSAGSCRLIGAQTTPYPADLRARVHALVTSTSATFREIGGVDVALGRFFGECARALIAECSLRASDIVAIGHHGQTVHHQPLGPEPFTLQLGDPNSVAAIAGITTVADFRRRDIADGGQGAPLVPAFHDWMFRAGDETRVILNLGGIANVTVLRPAHPTTGFDTGPGNTLLDEWIRRCRGLPFDRDGAWSASGTVDGDLLHACLREPYFDLPPPKSTGRELFNSVWLDRRFDEARRPSAEDVQATLAELTAASIVAALARAGAADGRLIVCGGGAYNHDLLSRLGRLTGRAAESTAAFGIPPDWVEGAAFAWLARARLQSAVGNVPSVTGAHQAAVLGGIYYGWKAETTPQQLPSSSSTSAS